MGRQPWTLICLAYLFGLLSTGLLGFAQPHPSAGQWAAMVGIWLALSLALAGLMPRYGLGIPRPQFWLGMGLIALLAIAYYQFRLPVPSSTDISRLLSDEFPSIRLIVRGHLTSEPQLTGDQTKRRFSLTAYQSEYVRSGKERKVTGNLYVTLPLEESASLTPGQSVTVQGRLYRLRSPQNPGAFDFKTYLAQQGIFAGFTGTQLLYQSPPPSWGWWKLRRRIVAAQGRWLAPEAGKLLSSIALGQRAVDLPKDLRDRFAQVGLAHVLAASGFQVALLLGVVLRLTQHLAPRIQGWVGAGSLMLLIGLTGLQPSIFRAGVMGLGLLLGKALDRQVRPLGSLLLAATVLLVWNPIWIWDLGFQLSFLATLGLVISLDPILQRLDWLPPAIASTISIPLAANVWVLPLLMGVFAVVPTYSVGVNVLATPLVMILSLGGMISAALALVVPLAGSAIAFLLGWPLKLLTGLVDWVYALPSSSYAVGKLPLLVMIAMYGLLLWGWLGRGRRRSQIITAVMTLLVILPSAYQRLTLTQVTVLASPIHPVVVLQERGQTLLINGNDPQTLKYTLLPYLAQQGINSLDCWLLLSPKPEQSPGCSDRHQTLSIQQLRDRPSPPTLSPARVPSPAFALRNFSLQWLSLNPVVLQIQYRQAAPWWIVQANRTDSESDLDFSSNPTLLIGNPQSLQQLPLKEMTAEAAIAIASNLSPKLQSAMGNPATHWWITGKDGAIQWQPRQGWFTKETEERSRPF